MTSVDWVPIIISVISAIGVIYAVWTQAKKNRTEANSEAVGEKRLSEKDKADAAIAITEAWRKLLEPLEIRVTNLEHENQILRQRERVLWNYIDTLRAKLREIDANSEAIITHRGMGYSLLS